MKPFDNISKHITLARFCRCISIGVSIDSSACTRSAVLLDRCVSSIVCDFHYRNR